MRHTNGITPKRPYVSRRAVPSSLPMSSFGRANGSDSISLASTLKWRIIKCALISSSIGLMGTALFGVDLLEASSAINTTASTSDADGSNGGTVHGVHAVAGRDFLQAKREVDIPRKDTEAELTDTNADEPRSSLARGVSGLPLSQTPALVGGKRGHIDCDVDVDFLAYWNDPQGTRDQEFVSPFAERKDDGSPPKYLTFQPDSGGWNNIRMSLETIFIMALALDRTLVLPPPMPLYLLNKDKADRHREFGDFYPLKSPQWRNKLNVITTEEFLEREGGSGGRFPIPEVDRTAVLKAAKGCVHMKKSDHYCGTLDHYFQSIATVPAYHKEPYDPNVKKREGCFVFDVQAYNNGGSADKPVQERAAEFCSDERHPFYFTKELNVEPIIHFKASEKGYRLCQHFYGAMLFTDAAIDNYYKRFVRDYMRYHDTIYCAAGKVVAALRKEGADRGFEVDPETETGGYSAMHIRRGDLQFKRVKFGPEQWWTNTKEIWQPKEIIYIATDERNKTWFDPLREHADIQIRFLDDYFEEFKLGELDGNYMGMIDTIIASAGRAFAGTFFSTFSGYIIRMRGYKGTPMRDSYYSLPDRKYEMRKWYDGPARHIFSHEWQDGWLGIDGDTVPDKGTFGL